MTKKTYKVVTEDFTYKFELMKAKKAIRIGFKLNKLILPTLASTVDGLKKDEFVHGARSTFKDAAEAVVTKLDEVEADALIEELFEECTIDGDEIDFDEHFQGRLNDIVVCVEKILKENFSSLFTGKTLDMFVKMKSLL